MMRSHCAAVSWSGGEERLDAQLLAVTSTGVPIVETTENHRSVLSPYANCTSMIGISGAIERGAAVNTAASAPVRSRCTSSAVVRSITPPTASRRARSSSAGATSSQFSTAARTGPGSSISRRTFAGSGTGVGRAAGRRTGGPRRC